MKNRATKILSAFLALLMVVLVLPTGVITVNAATLWDGTSDYNFAGGSGTESDPYLIETAKQLAYFAQSVNEGATFEGQYIRLDANISLNDESFAFDADTGLIAVNRSWNTYYLGTGMLGDTSGSVTTFDTTASTRGAWYSSVNSTETTTYPNTINVWTPIGASSAFKGNFDGNGRIVTGLYINTDDDYQGLFGYTQNATIKNLGIVNSYINGNEQVGGVVGYAYAYSYDGGTSIVENCYNQGIVLGYYEVGGVIGNCYATINDSVTSSVTVKNCYNTGTIYSHGGSAGGVVGKNEYNGLVEDCYNTGTVIGKDYIGGVVGFNDAFFDEGSGTPTARNCYNTGTVKGVNYSNGHSEDIGGVVGRNENAVVENCYNKGNVIGYDSVGGVVGHNMNTSIVSNSHNQGKVIGSETAIGGVVGLASPYPQISITNCYNTGEVSLIGEFSDNISDHSLNAGLVGGIVGEAFVYSSSYALTIERCYNTGSISGSVRVGGILGGFVDSDNYSSQYGYNITIEKCYNMGAVNGKFYVGGIAGSFGEYGSKFENSYNAGAVSGNSYVGGIIGYRHSYANPQSCYNVGTVTGSENTDAIMPGSYADCVNGYYLETCVSGQSTCNGSTALTDAQMKIASSFTGFDFDTVWEIGKTCGYDYPALKGVTVAEQNHVYSDSCDTTCNSCGYLRTDAHNRNNEYKDCETSVCVDCGAELPAIAEHTRLNADPCIETECSVCGVALAATAGHTWNDGVITTAPTCTTEGVKTFTCTVCGQTYTESIDKLTAHVWDAGVITTAPTCTTAGVKTFTCPCGETYTETILATGHHVLTGGVETVDSIRLQNATNYPFSYSNGTYTSTNKSHSSSSAFTITALYDCTLVLNYGVSSESNYDKLIISKNGTSLKTISGSLSNQTLTISLVAGDVVTVKYTKDVSVSTGSDAGWFKITSGAQVEIDTTVRIPAEEADSTCLGVFCEDCGIQVKPATDHAWNGGVITIAPTHMTEGTMTYTCVVCGETYTGSIAKLTAHEWDDGVITTQPTHTTEGIKTFTCPCGETYTESIDKLTDHEWNDGVITTAPTCTTEGVKTFTCPCGETYTEAVETVEHNMQNGACTVCGLIVGTCGNNLTWTFNQTTGALTISGTGAMTDYTSSSSSRAPWYSCRSSIQTVTIGNGVTSIGNYAFSDCSSLAIVTIGDGVTSIGNDAFSWCSSLTSITIPDSVTSIGNYAFSWCSSLTSITIPDSVTSIGKSAFYYCNSLTSVIIPNGVTSIGAYAFNSCSNLTDVTIPDTVSTIGERAFFECASITEISIPKSVCNIERYAFALCRNLVSIEVDEENSFYSSEDGVLYNKDKTVLIQYPIGNTDTYFHTPNSVTSIYEAAFHSAINLVMVVMNNSVTDIGLSAFYNCSNLETCAMPDSVVNIGVYAFYGCSKLTELDYVGRDDLPSNLKSIKSDAFYGCTSLIQIEDGVSYVDNWVIDCDESVTTVTLRENTVGIADGAFYDCSSLTSITIPDGVTSIGEDTFAHCSSLTNITIPDSVTSIGDYAFYNCSRLTSITIGNGVTSIGEYAFRYCNNLEKIIYLGTESEWNAITKGLGWDSDIGAYTIEYQPPHVHAYEGVITTQPTHTTEGIKTFTCSCGDSYTEPIAKLTDHEWDDGVITTQPTHTTEGVKTYTCSCGDSYTESIDKLTAHEWDNGVITTAPTCTTAGIKTFTCPCGKTYTEAIEALGHSMQDNICTVCGLISGTCGNNLTWTFNATTGALTISGTGAMTDYSSSSYPWYSYRSSIKTVTIEEGVTSIEYDAFSHCRSLTSITISNSVTSIGDYAFSYCDFLTNVTIGNGVTSIGNSAFNRCTSLMSITVASENPNYTSIDGNLYNKNATTLIQYAVGKTNTSFTIPSSVTSIGDKAFSYCKSLTSITILNGVTSIGDSAFYYCSKLTSITIPNGVTSIGDSAFSDCSSLTSITIPDSVTSIGYAAFEYCSSLTSITIPDGVISIGNFVFNNCSSLTSITLSDSIEYIGSSMFDSCSALKSIIIPNAVKGIADFAFYGCSSLTSITLPNGVKSIGPNAFEGCTSLASITIPNSITYIDWYAFADCGNLEKIIYNGTEAEWNAIEKYDNWDFNTGSYTIEYQPPHEHAYEGVITTQPTHTTEGIKTFTCPCGETYTESIDKLTAHEWDDGVITTAPTCTTEGVKTFTCPCGESYTEVIPTTRHTYTLVTENETCTENGLKTYTCTTCGYSYTVSIPATGHTYTLVTKHATCTENGLKTYTCITCGYSYTVSIPAKGHTMQNGICVLCGLHDIVSGTCGTSANWTLDLYTYELRIFGTGAMDDYNNLDTPWKSYASQIQTVTIEEGITAIGHWAFRKFNNLTTLNLPNTLQSIGSDAFFSCDQLLSVRIPNGVTHIGYYAFAECTALQDLTLPESLLFLGHHAFSECYYLIETVNSLSYVGTWVVEADADITYAEIRNGTIGIAEKAFVGCNMLTSVVLPDSLKIINTSAFFQNQSLTEVTFGNSLERIDNKAFAECPMLREIALPKSLSYIGNSAFYACVSLESISVHEENPIFAAKGNGLIEKSSKRLILGCKNTVMPNDGSVTSIGRSAFSGCSTLTIVYIPTAVTYIESDAFWNCQNLQTIVYCDTQEMWNAIQKEQNWDYQVGINTSLMTYKVQCHSYSGQVANAPTHTEEGLMVYTCFCGDSYTEKLEKISEHSYNVYKKYDSNQHKVFCGCGDFYYGDHVFVNGICSLCKCFKDSNVDPNEGFLGEEHVLCRHDWGEGVVITEASCTSNGLKTYTCSHCKRTMDEVLPMLDHVYDTFTSQDMNVHNAFCSCGHSIYEDHDWKANYIMNFKMVYSCADCNATKSVSLPYLAGDANADGLVNLNDAVLIKVYLANYNYTTGYSPIGVAPGADANGDGTIELADAVLLALYLANFDYETGSSTVVLGPQNT